MRKLTKGDIENIIGRNIEEFRIEAARLRPLCHMAIPSA